MSKTDEGAGTAREGTEMEGVEIKVGDRVEYHAVEGGTQTSTGVIKEIVTEPTNVTGRNVKASEDEPRYVIENENTGKESAIYKKAIERKIEFQGGGSKQQKGSSGGGRKKGGPKKKQEGAQEGGEEEEEDELEE
ncbi:hypothetical protein DFJ74DRAFT_502736 [Hyaloraphidium curvatum]|nr:hypothetical protein DFJ74DRAFT_502736 [Hyaloraphidium curvatum]